MARQILHAIFAKIFTWTRAADGWWLHGLVFGIQTPKQCNAKQRVLRSLYLIYLCTCAYVSPSTHRFVIAKLSCVTHKQNEMKESVQTPVLIVIPAKITAPNSDERKKHRLQSIHNARDNNIVKLYSHARCFRTQWGPCGESEMNSNLQLLLL